MAILQHYGLPTKALDVTFDPNVALWLALHVAKRAKRRLSFEDSPQDGCVYVLWVPVTFDWAGDRGRYYRWARTRGLRSRAGLVAARAGAHGGPFAQHGNH
jgi:hypothetical protein